MTSTTIPLTEPIVLQCRIALGRVEVRTHDGRTDAVVTLSSSDPESSLPQQTTVALQGRVLHIRAPKPKASDLPGWAARARERDHLNVVVDVPSGTDLRLGLLHGDVRVSGRAGNIDVGNGLGRMEFDEVSGDLRLRYGSGSASVERVAGSVSLKSGHGDVRVGEAAGSVDIAHGSGDLQIAHSRGRVRLKTGAGTLSIESAEGDLDLTSGAGEVRVGLPRGQVARLDVVTGLGTLHTDLSVDNEKPQPADAAARKPITIRARTGSGDVYIHRAS